MARIKGVDLVGTGDFTHPLWLNELKEALASEEDGVYGEVNIFSKEKEEEQKQLELF